MATKYRIVEEGPGVYLEYKTWLFWSRETKRHSPSSAWDSPITTAKNYGTVEAAQKEIDRRLADEARWVPRVTAYPPA
jgi:hypothetical protein